VLKLPPSLINRHQQSGIDFNAALCQSRGSLMPSYGFAVSITKTSEPGKIPDKSGRGEPLPREERERANAATGSASGRTLLGITIGSPFTDFDT
jgi:hypothetical protein